MNNSTINVFLNDIFEDVISDKYIKPVAIKFICDACNLLEIQSVEEMIKFFIVGGDIRQIKTYDKYDILKQKQNDVIEKFFKIPEEARLTIYIYIQTNIIDYLNKNNKLGNLNNFVKKLNYQANNILTADGRKLYFSDFLKRNIFTQNNKNDALVIEFLSEFASGFIANQFTELFILSCFLPDGEVSEINSYNKFNAYLDKNNKTLLKFLNQDTSTRLKLFIYIQENIKIYFEKIKLKSYADSKNNITELYGQITLNLINKFNNNIFFIEKIKNIFGENFLLENNWYDLIVNNCESICSEYGELFSDERLFGLPLYTYLSCLKMFFSSLLIYDLINSLAKNQTDVLAINSIVEAVNITFMLNPKLGKNIYKKFLILEGDFDKTETYSEWSIYNNDRCPTFKEVFSMLDSQKIQVFKAINKFAPVLYKKSVSSKQRIINALKNNLIYVGLDAPYKNIITLNFIASCIVYELEDLYLNKSNIEMMKYFLANGDENDINSYKKYDHFKVYQDDDINNVFKLSEKERLSIFAYINTIAINYINNKLN